jgi:hypothetical protein
MGEWTPYPPSPRTATTIKNGFSGLEFSDDCHGSSQIKEGTPLARLPLSDPGMRNDRTGLIRNVVMLSLRRSSHRVFDIPLGPAGLFWQTGGF